MKTKTSNTVLIPPLDSPQIHLNKIPWDKILLRTKPLRKVQNSKLKGCHAFDTETLDGYAKLICDDRGVNLLDGNIDQILLFLCNSKYRDTHNFFYNVQFDFDAIMKHLPYENISELAYQNETIYGAYKIKFIPKKMFTISLHGNSYRYYDLAQFYEMSLEKAGKMYVSEIKNEDNLDRARIGSEAGYWEDNLNLIIKYCIQDCVITRKLADLLQSEIINTCGFNPKDYISKAGLSKRYFREKCEIPDTLKIPNFVKYYAFESYHGGRFEVTERGKVGYCTNLDINSAYPWQIHNLIDITKGVWKRVTDIHENAYYGFYLATVTIPYMYLPPLALNWYNTIIYPCGTWTAYFTLDELKTVATLGEYEIITGVEFYPDQIIYPFREAIQTLYHQKQITPKSDFKYALYKKIQNSFYGALYEKLKLQDGQYKTGLLFNPVYASLITSGTRLQLWRKAQEFGQDCISLATDGLLIKGHIKTQPCSDLGAWDQDKSGESYILRSGIYSVGSEIKQRGVVKTNYFHTPKGDYENLFDYIRDYPEQKTYPVLNNRPWHLIECIKHNKVHTVEDINVFTESEIAFDLNTDVKRIFDVQDICGRDLLDTRISSKPHLFGF